MSRTAFIITGLALLLLAQTLCAEPQFPKLSGRVVDQANLLSRQSEAQLVATLAEHEKQTSNQIVVLTVQSLGGLSIEDYAYQLGRHWAIGQKQINNGVLLIIAPNERKVRIDVGYGLEGVLTDALSSNIIHNEILPAFRKKQFEQGITNATLAIINALAGSYKPTNSVSKQTEASKLFDGGIIFLVFSIFIGNVLLRAFSSRFLPALGFAGIASAVAWFIFGSLLIVAGIGALIFLWLLFNSGRGGGFGGGGFSSGRSYGGGFSGGGGSFGGGGASGGW